MIYRDYTAQPLRLLIDLHKSWQRTYHLGPGARKSAVPGVSRNNEGIQQSSEVRDRPAAEGSRGGNRQALTSDLAPAEPHQLGTPKSFRFQEVGHVLNLKVSEFYNPEVIKSLESPQPEVLFADFPSGPVAMTPLPLQEIRETRVRPLGREDPLDEGMATRSSILAWRAPWTEEPGGLQSLGLQTVRHD